MSRLSPFWLLVVVLAVLHQDFWLWDDRTLVFGFVPAGLAYHAGYSLAAAGLWALALKVVWPSHLEEWASETDATDDAAASAGEEPR